MKGVLLRSLMTTYIQRENTQFQEADPRKNPQIKAMSFLNKQFFEVCAHTLKKEQSLRILCLVYFCQDYI